LFSWVEFCSGFVELLKCGLIYIHTSRFGVSRDEDKVKLQYILLLLEEEGNEMRFKKLDDDDAIEFIVILFHFNGKK